jgi:hypothetical protein
MPPDQMGDIVAASTAALVTTEVEPIELADQIGGVRSRHEA